MEVRSIHNFYISYQRHNSQVINICCRTTLTVVLRFITFPEVPRVQITPKIRILEKFFQYIIHFNLIASNMHGPYVAKPKQFARSRIT